MSIVTSFSPIANKSANVLILGSMPGVISLKENQYYAHPSNGFWRIMASIYGFNAKSDYNIRVNNLILSDIALWDVLRSCERLGSLDSDIRNGSRICNDFKFLFNHCPNIKLIAFNGVEAEKSFNKFVMPQFDIQHLTFIRLPSSSPANTQALKEKILIWRQGLKASTFDQQELKI
ncbi:MAG: DNA-deoxyinosine glycosylase [Bacteroidia bacterium]|nr:DNA-deoxyinosine glycosylase [Methylotenera sp.]